MQYRNFTVLILLLSLVMCTNAQKVVQISSTDVQAKIQTDKSWVILDVRTADEYNDGHIDGAKNIDIRQPDAFSKIDSLDRNAKYIVHCRTNHRSKIAVDHMVEKGFKTIYQMTDGYNGWSEHGLPIKK